MLRKKNYKQQDHYTQYYNFSIPTTSGKKIIIYYKRYKPKFTSSEKVVQIYDLIQCNKNPSLQKSKQIKQNSKYPLDRTLELITFDNDLSKLSKFESIMKKIGKIRKFQYGQGQLKNRPIYYCIVIFKYEFDLVKCFKDDYLQIIVQTYFKTHQNQQDREDYKSELISTYLAKELEEKNKKIKALHQQGWNLVTNKIGQFEVNRQANEKWLRIYHKLKNKKRDRKRKLYWLDSRASRKRHNKKKWNDYKCTYTLFGKFRTILFIINSLSLFCLTFSNFRIYAQEQLKRI